MIISDLFRNKGISNGNLQNIWIVANENQPIVVEDVSVECVGSLRPIS